MTAHALAPMNKTRLAVDFASPAALVSFVDWLQEQDLQYAEADAYPLGQIGTLSPTGMTVTDTFILKNSRNRQPGSALRDELDQN